MNIIKGLITKDLLQLKSYKKTMIIFIFIFTATSLIQDNTETITTMLIIMLTLGFGMFSIASFNYDESAKADKYIMTLPLSKKEILLSKYILVICSTIIGAIIGIIVSSIVTLLLQKQLPNMFELITIALGGIFGIGIIEAIQIPCIYKYGAEKGRIQIFIVMAIFALLAGGIFLMVEKLNINIEVNNMLNKVNTFLPFIIVLLTIIMYFISYKIAYKIYKNKEI